jgi:hypothetical protein
MRCVSTRDPWTWQREDGIHTTGCAHGILDLSRSACVLSIRYCPCDPKVGAGEVGKGKVKKGEVSARVGKREEEGDGKGP